VSNPYKISLALTAAVANNIAASQSLASAGNLNLNGVAVASNVATITSTNCLARRVGITSAGNDTALTWTITGTDRYGNQQSESLAGANAGVAQSVKDYATVTKIAGSRATASTVTAGTTTVGSTEWRCQDFFRETFNVGAYVGVSGTVNCTVEYTFDDPNAALPGSLLPLSNQPPVATGNPDLTGLTAAATAQFTTPVFAIRLTVNSGTGIATLTLIQTGIGS
jgi:hypothetical protein